jgi:DNA-binding transcriptional LysR family regulator
VNSGWEGIEEFIAVEAAGSFSKGARALGVSTSHVSRAIVRLEDRIRAPLFFRTTRSVTLTDTGRALVEPFRRIISAREQAFATAGDDGEPQGELRLTCSAALGERFIVPIVRRFAQQYPRLSVNIDLSNRIIDLVAEGFDLAIRTGQLTDSRLVASRIASRRYEVCASPEYLQKCGRPETVPDLARHDCLIGTSATWHFEVDRQAVTFRPAGRWRCNSGEAVVDAALSDMGLCQLPELYVLPHIAAGRLVAVLETFRASDEPIWAVYPRHDHMLPKIRKLLPLLRAELGPALL